ncbi:hypothetical protein [Amnibacterium kyonggiense]|uniref:Uncharacterized protein n=1 Tax=Amnibacterium kyonggiense TaxID=595671 RepID=A0A4R7FGD6_9MICO|nr:hypothetical protein [Amnibacterium kyonggiense]TDS75667.1 hypothetical protein CLV52_2774 [Amnibacterium kyonggiense]
MSSTARFDVAAYVRAPFGPMRATLQGVGSALPADLADALRYVQRRAQGTGSWLSHVLVTATHKDARITAFLSTWAYEAHWFGDALSAIAGAGPVPAIRRGVAAKLRDRFGPLREAVVANLHGRALTGVQMTERLVDGWIVDAMLERAQQLAPTGVAEDLARIREGIARQGRFFAEAATDALSHSRAARVLARRRLAKRTWPIGADHEPAAATARALQALFGPDRSWATAIDSRIDSLPGLAGLHLVRRTVRKPGRPPFRMPLRSARSAAARSHRKDDAR